MKVGDRVGYGNGEWTVERIDGDEVTIEQARRDWSGEDSIAVATVPTSRVRAISPIESDLRDRWRPSDAQVADADAVLSTGIVENPDNPYVFTIHLLVNKRWGVWTPDVVVEPLDGVYTTREAAFEAVSAVVARRRAFGHEVIGGYALHSAPGQWAVWDLPC